MDLVCVLGGARSGSWAAKLAVKKGFQVILSDEGHLSNKAELEALGIRVYDGAFEASLLDMDFVWVIKNPGIPDFHPFIKKMASKFEITNEVEFAQHFVPSWELVAISGTNGKTTTTQMCGDILAAGKTLGFVAGNIGVPLSQVVYEHPNVTQAYGAVEMAGFMLSNTKHFQPKVATLVSLAPDHLDVYPTLEAYYEAKWKVVENLRKDDYFLLNIDDPIIMETYVKHGGQDITVSLDQEANVCIKNKQVVFKGLPLFEVDKLKVLGEHNLMNAMLAATAAACLGVEPTIIKSVIEDFRGVEHRIEYVSEVKGITYYNDSKATNPQSTMVALAAFEKPVILLAGGYDKKIAFDELLVYQDKIKHVIVFGETKYILKETFKDAYVVEDLKEAVKQAVELGEVGDMVLFSPACASYDQFTNFEERGRTFKDLVHQIK